MARPAVAIALQNPIKPDLSTTVFAGQDADATKRARSYFTGYPPSSPQIGLLKDGELVFMLERWQIESRSADEIAHDLVNAFNKYCAAVNEPSTMCRQKEQALGNRGAFFAKFVRAALVVAERVDVRRNRLDLIVAQRRRTAAPRAHRNLVRRILDLIRRNAVRDQSDESRRTCR